MIELQLGPSRASLSAFRHFWGMYVTGFDDSQHCLPCLRGVRSRLVHKLMPTGGTPIAMTEAAPFDVLYLCGVSRQWSTNFHMVLRPAEGRHAARSTFNGLLVSARNADVVPIPPLPAGYRGLPASFTSCRNFQLGEALYGPSSSSRLAV